MGTFGLWPRTLRVNVSLVIHRNFPSSWVPCEFQNLVHVKTTFGAFVCWCTYFEKQILNKKIFGSSNCTTVFICVYYVQQLFTYILIIKCFLSANYSNVADDCRKKLAFFVMCLVSLLNSTTAKKHKIDEFVVHSVFPPNLLQTNSHGLTMSITNHVHK